MSISPFPPRRASPAGPALERRRARIVLLVTVLGIAAALLAYGVSPGVRHAVHTVKHAVSHVFDPDSTSHKHHKPKATSRAARPKATSQVAQPKATSLTAA